MKNFLLLLLFLGIFLPAGQAARYYVNAAAGNDANTGASWAQAFKTFQKAIEVANNNDEIWLTGDGGGISCSNANTTASFKCSLGFVGR